MGKEFFLYKWIINRVAYRGIRGGVLQIIAMHYIFNVLSAVASRLFFGESWYRQFVLADIRGETGLLFLMNSAYWLLIALCFICAWLISGLFFYTPKDE